MERYLRVFVWVGIILTVIVGGIVGVLWFASSITGEGPEPVRSDLVQVPTRPPTPSVVRQVSHEAAIPDFTDDIVRSMAGALSEHPTLASMLGVDRLVHRFVSAVEAIAGGYSPVDELDFLRPRQPFLVRDDDLAGLVISAGSFNRYDLAAEVFESIDSEIAVLLYRELEPALEREHSELSWSGSSFEDRLRAAVDHLLSVAVPTGQLRVERRTITYAFADEELERLSPAQRHLLRMGPSNVRKIQSKLLELRAAFGWPEPPAEDNPAPVRADATSGRVSDPVQIVDHADLPDLKPGPASVDDSAVEPAHP